MKKDTTSKAQVDLDYRCLHEAPSILLNLR